MWQSTLELLTLGDSSISRILVFCLLLTDHFFRNKRDIFPDFMAKIFHRALFKYNKCEKEPLLDRLFKGLQVSLDDSTYL